MIHTHSCGEPILDPETGHIIIECGGALDSSGMVNDFAQCSECVQKDIDAEIIKIKKGCETEFDNEKVKAFMYCGASYEGVTSPQLCPECQIKLDALQKDGE